MSSNAAATVGSPVTGKLHQGGTGSVGLTGYPSPPGSMPNPSILSTSMASNDGIQQLRKNGGTAFLTGSAIAEGHALEVSRGARNRRSSDGVGALGGVGKMGRMRSGSELKCDKCGKGYKHSSCLTKHLFVFPLHVFKDWFRMDKNCFSLLLPHTLDHYITYTYTNMRQCTAILSDTNIMIPPPLLPPITTTLPWRTHCTNGQDYCLPSVLRGRKRTASTLKRPNNPLLAFAFISHPPR
jgi:hypothetical protein